MTSDIHQNYEVLLHCSSGRGLPVLLAGRRARAARTPRGPRPPAIVSTENFHRSARVLPAAR
jgi:hypothetical protein